jgi:hypothetical protein
MNTIYNEIADEFGSSALSINNPLPSYALTIRQCQILNNKYGFDKAMVIAKRYASLQKRKVENE